MSGQVVPPNDVEAEAAVLSAVLLDPPRLSEVAPILQPADFYAQANRTIYEAVLALDAANGKIDVVTVQSWLKTNDQLQRIGGSAYLGQIIDCAPAVANVADYARIVVEKARMRRLIATCQQIAAEGYTWGESAQTFIDKAEQSVFELAGTREASGPERASEIAKRSFAELSNPERIKNLVSTGFSALDSVLVGLHRKHLLIVAARPGVGKTALADQIVWNVARKGWGALVFSLEMTKEEQSDRIMCQQALVNSRQLGKNPESLSKEDWDNLVMAGGQLAKLPIYIDDEGGISITSLRAKARQVAAQMRKADTKLALIVVDYLQLMAYPPSVRMRDEAVGSNSRNLKKLAKDLDVTVLAVSQLNRDVTKRGKDARPGLADLRESGSIEADADEIVFLHHTEGEPVSEAIVGKGRHYGTGTVKLAWKPTFARFDTLADEDVPPGALD